MTVNWSSGIAINPIVVARCAIRFFLLLHLRDVHRKMALCSIHDVKRVMQRWLNVANFLAACVKREPLVGTFFRTSKDMRYVGMEPQSLSAVKHVKRLFLSFLSFNKLSVSVPVAREPFRPARSFMLKSIQKREKYVILGGRASQSAVMRSTSVIVQQEKAIGDRSAFPGIHAEIGCRLWRRRILHLR